MGGVGGVLMDWTDISAASLLGALQYYENFGGRNNFFCPLMILIIQRLPEEWSDGFTSYLIEYFFPQTFR